MKLEYIFIKSNNDYMTTEDSFKTFLCSNKNIKIKEGSQLPIILFKDNELQYNLECVAVEKADEIIFHLVVEIMGDDDNQANILGLFNSTLLEINEKMGNHFYINTIWNDVSLYYGRKLYPDILRVENMLRKIIYLFMLKTVGSEWIDTGTPQKFQMGIDNVIQKNNKIKKEIHSEWLIYADFITLVYFFTVPYAL